MKHLTQNMIAHQAITEEWCEYMEKISYCLWVIYLLYFALFRVEKSFELIPWAELAFENLSRFWLQSAFPMTEIVFELPWVID